MNPPVNLWTSPRESSVCVPVWDHWSGVAAASFPGWWDLVLKMWSSTECGQLLLEVRKVYRVSVEFPFWCFLTCYCFLTIPKVSAFLLSFWTFSKGFYLKGRVTGDLRGWLIFLPSLFTVQVVEAGPVWSQGSGAPSSSPRHLGHALLFPWPLQQGTRFELAALPKRDPCIVGGSLTHNTADQPFDKCFHSFFVHSIIIILRLVVA